MQAGTYPLLHLFQQGVNQQHAGFDVGRNDNAALDHLGKPVSGVLKALVVPGEGAALDALLGFHGAVAGGKLEPSTGMSSSWVVSMNSSTASSLFSGNSG